MKNWKEIWNYGKIEIVEMFINNGQKNHRNSWAMVIKLLLRTIENLHACKSVFMFYYYQKIISNCFKLTDWSWKCTYILKNISELYKWKFIIYILWTGKPINHDWNMIGCMILKIQ